MKKYFLFLITTAVIYSCNAQNFIVVSNEGTFLDSTVKAMGVTLSVDTTVKYPNGGSLVEVKYPEGLLTGKEVLSSDTLEDGAVMQITAPVTAGSQGVSGATSIIVLSATSFRVVREIEGRVDVSYIFEPHKAVRQDFDYDTGHVTTTQVLP